MLVARYVVKTYISVPICYSCDRRRTMAAWLAHPLVFFASMALLFTGGALIIQTDQSLLGIVCGLLGLIVFVLQRNEVIDTMLDYKLLGVCGITHMNKGELTTVSIRDAALCGAVEELTKETENSEILLRPAQSATSTNHQELLRSHGKDESR